MTHTERQKFYGVLRMPFSNFTLTPSLSCIKRNAKILRLAFLWNSWLSLDFNHQRASKMALQGIYFSSPKVQKQYNKGNYVRVMQRPRTAGIRILVFTVPIRNTDFLSYVICVY